MIMTKRNRETQQVTQAVMDWLLHGTQASEHQNAGKMLVLYRRLLQVALEHADHENWMQRDWIALDGWLEDGWKLGMRYENEPPLRAKTRLEQETQRPVMPAELESHPGTPHITPSQTSIERK